MPYKIGTAVGHYDLLDQIKHYACGYGVIGTITYSGTGNGVISDTDTFTSSVSETWTVACTSASANAGVFSVTGSVSGALADATVGVDYDNGLIAFTINDGAVDFVATDSFSIPVTAGALNGTGDVWEIQKDDTSTDDHELILKGAGLSGAEEIFIGFKTIQDVTGDYYNLIVAAMTGYVPGNDFNAQPGIKESTICLWQFSIPYWLVVNGQRISFAANVEAHYELAYAGKFLPYMSPGQFPYPVSVIGSLDGESTTRYSDLIRDVGVFVEASQFKIRFLDGLWTTVKVWPFASGTGTYELNDTHVIPTVGDYNLLPLVLYNSSKGVYGELDGVLFISGFAMAVEDTISYNSTDYIVIRNIHRTGFFDYIALKLE